jgi:RNA polymerase sigma factor (sigma-70 family)
MCDDAFEAVLKMHHTEIYRYLVRTTGQTSAADDLSQETFLRAFKAYRSLPGDANVRAWLFTIATNLLRNHRRSAVRQDRAYAAFKDDLSKVEQLAPDDVLRFKETRTRIELTLSRLPLKQRLAFTLRKFHNLDYDKIGQSLGCSPDSARANVFQALKKLRHSVAPDRIVRKERVR